MMTLKRPHIIALHVLCWLLFFSIPVLFLLSQSTEQAAAFPKPLVLGALLIYPVVFYAHTYFLLPKLFFRRKYILYTISTGLLIAAVILLRPYDSMVRMNMPADNRPLSFRPGPIQKS
jgi:two-component system LytT family sensor kinase